MNQGNGHYPTKYGIFHLSRALCHVILELIEGRFFLGRQLQFFKLIVREEVVIQVPRV